MNRFATTSAHAMSFFEKGNKRNQYAKIALMFPNHFKFDGKQLHYEEFNVDFFGGMIHLSLKNPQTFTNAEIEKAFHNQDVWDNYDLIG